MIKLWSLIPWKGQSSPEPGERPRAKPPSRRHVVRSPESLEDRTAPVGGIPFTFTAPVAEALTLKYDGTSELEILNQSGTMLAEQTLASTSNVVVNGFTSGTNSLKVDYGNEITIPVAYNGASGGSNSLTFINGMYTQSSDQVLDSNSGSVTLIDGNNVSESVAYSHVQSVTDLTTAADRTFDATPITGGQQIRLTTNGDSPGQQTIDANGSGGFAAFTFADPTVELTVDGGPGGNSVFVDSLDAGFKATGPSLSIVGGAGSDNVFVPASVQQFAGNFNGMGGQNALLYAGNSASTSFTSTNVQATVTSESVSLDGGFNNLSGLIQGQATYTLSVQSGVAATTGSGTSLTGAVVYTFSLTAGPGQQLTIGTPGANVAITSGTITLAVLTSTSGSYLGVSAQGLGGSINVPDVTGTLSNGTIAINQGPVSGDSRGSLNWGSLTSDPFPSGFSTQPGVQISGVATVSLFGVVNVAADVAYASQPVNVQLSSGNLTAASLVTVGVNTLVNGSTTGGSSIGIAAIEPPTSGTDSRYWIAVSATGLSASLALGSSATAAVERRGGPGQPGGRIGQRDRGIPAQLDHGDRAQRRRSLRRRGGGRRAGDQLHRGDRRGQRVGDEPESVRRDHRLGEFLAGRGHGGRESDGRAVAHQCPAGHGLAHQRERGGRRDRARPDRRDPGPGLPHGTLARERDR